MRTARVLGWTVGALALTVGITRYACLSLLHGMCRNDALAVADSPDRTHKLISFQRDCGATTGFSAQVSLLDSDDDLPNEPGNVFIADRGAAPAGPGGGPDVRVQWHGDRAATIGHHQGARVFKSERDVDGIAFKFEHWQ